MATDDGFTAGDNSSGTSGETFDVDKVEYKYAQMVVPNFVVEDALTGTGDVAWLSAPQVTTSSTPTSSTSTTTTTTSGATTTTTVTDSTGTTTTTVTRPSGNSFLRLGSFPVAASGSSASNYSLGVDTATSAGAPTGFSDSLTLAKLVGDPKEVATAQASDDSTSTNDDKLFTSDPFKGNKMRGFVDDTRIRDDKNTDVLYIKGSSSASSVETNTTDNREAETRRLLTKGGWWDHSDGNRISTTAGDKIEVIQGNYKMVVLGRRKANDTGDLRVVDISGGLEYTKTHEYLESENVWATYEESSKKYATKRSSGKEITYFEGTLKESITGKDPDTGDVLPDENKDPVVRSKTWAKKIETYIGTESKPVPDVISISHTGARTEVTASGAITNFRIAYATFVQLQTAGVLMADMKATLGPLVEIKATATALFDVKSAAKLLLKTDLSPLVHEIKVGNICTFSTAQSYVSGSLFDFSLSNKAFSVKKDQIDGINNAIASLRTDLSNTVTTVHNHTTHVHNNTLQIDNVDLRIAVIHNYM
ncbi:hypothetical protein WME79_18955 [Sorangium sp. So ce726]|uniref:hypothetical protein n=1 Tax=Sorangium sp. So ce726 TaxID=3133319 RepID=UPI003F5DC6D4